MTIFYFHVCTGCERVTDKRGRTFPDLAQATRFAVRYAQLLKAKARYKHIDFKVIEIRSEGGQLACTVPFASVISSIAAGKGRLILAPTVAEVGARAPAANRGRQTSLETWGLSPRRTTSPSSIRTTLAR